MIFLCWCCRCRIATLIISLCGFLQSCSHSRSLSLCHSMSSCRVHVRSVCLCTWICVHKHFEYAGELSFFFLCSVSWFYWECFFPREIAFWARIWIERQRENEFMSFVIFHTILFSRLAYARLECHRHFESAVGLRQAYRMRFIW